MKEEVSIVWFRRDLRVSDNCALYHALESGKKVLPLFIFDSDIITKLPKTDARITFIHQQLESLNNHFNSHGGQLLCLNGKPLEVWEELINKYNVQSVFTNKDYEPYAIKRDLEVESLLKKSNISFHSFKDQVIFEEDEVTKDDGKPYTVYTPYKNKWISKLRLKELSNYSFDGKLNLLKLVEYNFPTLSYIGFEKSNIEVLSFDISDLEDYENTRNFPSLDATSKLSPHLRFGTVSIRQLVKKLHQNEQFLFELVWRDFFMQTLFHFPHVVKNNFKPKYDKIAWRNNEAEFKLWCEGKTGYPIVDAGMRELNETGYMHNRVRMITAGFLCKHLLIDWRWGEAYFAEKLLDYDLSANNGNWQWSAGTGCDAAPYFRVFNPSEQIKKFDKELTYIRKWVKEFDSLSYPTPMVEHKFARQRALDTYKKGLEAE